MINKVEVKEKCYQMFFDLATALKNSFHQGYDLFERLSLVGDILLYNGQVFIWLKQGVTKQDLLRRLHRYGIAEVFCQEIGPTDAVVQEPNIVSTWFAEHYVTTEKELLEEANQDFLRDCSSRIEQAKLALKQKIKKGAEMDGKQSDS